MANNTSTSIQANDTKVEEHIAFIADTEAEEHIAFVTDQDRSGIADSVYDDGKYYNFDHVPTSDEMDMHLIYYDWLVDSRSTSHINAMLSTYMNP